MTSSRSAQRNTVQFSWFSPYSSQAYRKDVDKESSEIHRVCQLGKELLEGREYVRGANEVASQLDNINLRWEIIVKTTNNREQVLETALERLLHEEHKRVMVWVQRRGEQVLQIESFIEESSLPQYIQVCVFLTHGLWSVMSFSR